MEAPITIAVIGSFRQHNAKVQETCEVFRNAGLVVTSPVGTDLVEESISFVRFTSDDTAWTDHAIQTLALHRILSAHLTYVVAPNGYVGRTTCYEIGRLLQARKPVYFSDSPVDLPIYLSQEFIVDANRLAELLTSSDWEPTWLHEYGQEHTNQLERELIYGKYRHY